MIERVSKFIQECDHFGSIFLLRIAKTDNIFKTLYGGLLSICIFMISAAYFVYLMFAWSSGELPPTVTTQIYDLSEEGISLSLTQSVFVFGLDIEQPTKESRYAQQHQKFFYKNSTIIEGDQMFQVTSNDECNVPLTQWDFFGQICQNLDERNQSRMFADPLRTKDTYFVVNVYYCHDQVDKDCVSQQLREDIIINQNSYWRLTLIKQDFDFISKTIRSIPTDYYFRINPNYNKTSLFVQIKVQKGVIVLDEGTVFTSIREIELVNDLQLLVSEYAVESPKGPHIEVSLEKYTTVKRVQYPKLGQVLAILGSLFQGLLFSGYLLGIINQKLMYGRVKELLLQMYFPDFSQVKFQKDWKQNVVGVYGEKLTITQQDQNMLLTLRETLLSSIEDKFNYVHLLKEINKLQISLMMIFPRKHIRMIQNLNYNLIKPPIGLEPQLNILEGKNQIQSYLPLNQDDFIAISQAKWKEYDTSWETQDEDLEENGEFLMKAFYDKVLQKIIQNNQALPSLGCESAPLPKYSISISQSNILAQKPVGY